MKNLKVKNTNIELSEFSAALSASCPRCRKGDMYATPMYGFKAQKMNTRCPHCDLLFEREPGYFYVAMFVSYAFNVAELIALAIGTYLLTGNDENPYLYMAVLFAGVFILSPFNYRYSRVVLMYWLTPGMKFQPELSKSKVTE